MKKVVVTGAGGFIGRAFTDYLLDRGHEVFAVTRDPVRLACELSAPNLKTIKADLAAYGHLAEKIPAAETFYHFVWDGVWGKKAGDYEVQLQNIKAACAALEQAARMGCKKFVLAGSVSELEIREHLDRNICRPRLANIYAAAKLTAEIMCKTLAVRNQIEISVGLLANTFGPGDRSRRSTNIILGKMLNGEAPALVKGEGLNDWLYIRDAVRLLEAMGERGKNGKTYYIGHTNLWPLRKTIERARDAVAPGLKLEFGTVPDEFLTDYSYISTGELYADTGCKAEYDFEQAVRETAVWVREIFKCEEKHQKNIQNTEKNMEETGKMRKESKKLGGGVIPPSP